MGPILVPYRLDYSGWGMTGQDQCLKYKHEESITTIVKHVITTKDVKALTVVFPYSR